MTGEGAFAGRSVLVVEDESFTRMVLAKMLAALGFATVLQASDGDSGLAEVAAHAPDAVLCDVEMQPTDGFAFVRSLRSSGDPRSSSLPVVLMSSRVDDGRRQEALGAGADALLAKPVSAEDLRRAFTPRFA